MKDTRLDINSKNKNGSTPFHLACINGHLAILEILIKDIRLKINSKDNDGNTGFHYACKNGHLAIVDFLIKDAQPASLSLEINSKNKYSWTPFHLACLYGHLAIVDFLMKDAHLKINSRNNYGWTPFHFACNYGINEIISLFLNSNIQSTQEYFGYRTGTTSYDILKEKNINLDPVKEKISKNEKLIFYAADGDLSELKYLLQRKKLNYILTKYFY